MGLRFVRSCSFLVPALLLSTWACQAPPRENPAQAEAGSVEIVRSYITALNEVDYEALRGTLKDGGAVAHYRGSTYQLTPELERDIQTDWKRAFPDHEYRIEMIFAKGDTVVSRMMYTGTHRDTILGIPPTGRSVAAPEMAIYRLEEGRIAEEWVIFDEYELRRQLGAG